MWLISNFYKVFLAPVVCWFRGHRWRTTRYPGNLRGYCWCTRCYALAIHENEAGRCFRCKRVVAHGGSPFPICMACGGDRTPAIVRYHEPHTDWRSLVQIDIGEGGNHHWVTALVLESIIEEDRPGGVVKEQLRVAVSGTGKEYTVDEWRELTD